MTPARARLRRSRRNRIGALSGQLLHVREEQTSGTNGGTFTNGARRQRTLNTVKTTEISGAALSFNQITGLPVGTYYVRARAPAREVDQHKLFVRDMTGATDLVVGNSAASSASVGQNNEAHVEGRFTLGTTSTIELQHICGTTHATNGFGQGANLGTEVFAEVWLWKVA